MQAENWQEATTRISRDPIQRLKGQTITREENFGTAQLVCFTGTSVSNRRLVYNGDVNVQLVYYDIQADIWVTVQVTTCRGRGHTEAATQLVMDEGAFLIEFQTTMTQQIDSASVIICQCIIHF